MLSPERKKYLATWREKNREKVRDAQRRYYAQNKTICAKRIKVCQDKKRTEYTAKQMEWARKNPDKVAATRRRAYLRNTAAEIERVRRRQGRIRQGESNMSPAEFAEVQGMYEFCRIFPGFEVDHEVPLNGKYVSGLHVLANLQILSISKNRSKGNKFNEEWLKLSIPA